MKIGNFGDWIENSLDKILLCFVIFVVFIILLAIAGCILRFHQVCEIEYPNGSKEVDSGCYVNDRSGVASCNNGYYSSYKKIICHVEDR